MLTAGKLKLAAEQIPMRTADPATAHMFIVNPLTGSFLGRMFSTHPPLDERIARLMAMKGSAG